jgi:hypothetical protein
MERFALDLVVGLVTRPSAALPVSLILRGQRSRTPHADPILGDTERRHPLYGWRMSLALGIAVVTLK